MICIFAQSFNQESLGIYPREKDAERRPYHSLQLPEGSCSEEHVSLFSQVASDSRRENGLKLKKGKFGLKIRV